MPNDRGRGGTSLGPRRRWPWLALAAALVAAAVAAIVLRGRSRSDPAAGVDELARAACQAVVDGDREAFVALHVTPDDLSVDGRYHWVPYAGADRDAFDPWLEAAGDGFDRLRAHLEEDLADGEAPRCAGVAHVTAPDDPSDLEREQGRVYEVRVRVAGERERILVLGPSVLTGRGRLFHGEEHGLFARFADEPDADAPDEAPEEPGEVAGDEVPAIVPAAERAVPVAASPADTSSGGASEHELLARVRALDSDTPGAVDELIARDQRDEVVAVLKDLLRQQEGIGVTNAAAQQLRRIGEQPDYARRTERSPEDGPDDTDCLELVLELEDGALLARWRVFFGDRLFSRRPPYIEVSLTSQALPAGVEKRFDATAGVNTGSEVMTRDVRPGTYALGVFLWSQQSDGTQVSDNACTVFLDVGPPR